MAVSVVSCSCFTLTINCLDPGPIGIDMVYLGAIGPNAVYAGEYDGETYLVTIVSGNFSLVSINDINTPIFYLPPSVTNPCNRTDWIIGAQDFCNSFPIGGPYAQSAPNAKVGECENSIFSGDCTCKQIEILNKCSLFYKTCDGNLVQQNFTTLKPTIVGCFAGTPIVFQPQNGIISQFTASTCDFYCITGDSCCLTFSGQTEKGPVTGDLYPTGTLNGYPFFVVSASSQEDIILYYDENKKKWIAGNDTDFFELDTDEYCPVGNWGYLDGKLFTTLKTEVITCPTPLPSPTPTKTPRPTPLPSPTPKNKFYNECEPITLFPMGVECSVTQPTNVNSPDGSILLIITGGTPPYKVVWDNNNIGQVIYNLGPGSYGATVVDYYGDFTAKTNCILTGETPSPSPTPTPTPTKPYEVPSLCVTITIEGKTTKLTFTPSGLKNNKPYWSNTTFEIYWDNVQNKWIMSGILPSPNVIQNSNPSIPPLSNWIILGPYASYTQIRVTEGICDPMMMFSLPIDIPQPLTINVSANNPVCGCEGSITMIGSGGYPPYMYSINSGVTFRNIPFFTNLCSGTYTPLLMDSSGQSVSQTVILNKPSDPITYLVKTNTSYSINTNNGTVLSKTYTTTISVNPPLEDGVVLIFDFIHANTHRTSIQTGSSVNVSSTILYKNSSPITEDGTNSSTGTTTNIIPGCQDKLVYVNSNSEEWYSLQMINSDNYEIITNTSITKIDENPCYIGTSDEQYTIMNLRLSGCSCCNVFKI